MKPGKRLDASPETARDGEGAAAPQRHCLECGAAFTPGRKFRAEFCGRACRKAWNNRRMMRGAALYDLVMAHRFDRSEANRIKVWRAINRLASHHRDDDRAQRAGRRSWRRPIAVILDRVFLSSE